MWLCTMQSYCFCVSKKVTSQNTWLSVSVCYVSLLLPLKAPAIAITIYCNKSRHIKFLRKSSIFHFFSFFLNTHTNADTYIHHNTHNKHNERQCNFCYGFLFIILLVLSWNINSMNHPKLTIG